MILPALIASTVIVFSPQPAATIPARAAENRLLDLAYAAIDRHDDARARSYLLEADAAAPADPRPRKELFYVDLRLRRFDEAFAQARKAMVLHDTDPVFRLDVAYAMLDAQRASDADALLRSLIASGNRQVAAAARAQLAADDPPSGEPTSQRAAPDVASPTAPPAAEDTGMAAAYDAADRGDHAAALALLDGYLSRAPDDDRARLQRGYELLALGRQKDADAVFTALQTSQNGGVARAARLQLAMDREVALDRADTYAYYQHEGRFNANVYGGDVLLGARSEAGRVQPYVAVHAANDTGSGAGSLRQTLSDRVIAVDGGVRLAAGNSGALFAEAGEGFGLAGQGNTPDARYGYEAYREWGSGGGPLPHTAADLNAAVYSRYAGNAILYGQLTHDAALGRSLRAVVELNLAADSHRLYYNNTLEAGAGIQIGTPRLGLRLLTVRGIYLPRGVTRPLPSSYGTARTQLLFGLSL